MSWFSEHLGIPGILIIIGAIAGAAGVVLVNRESNKKQIEIAELNRKIAEKSDKIADLNEQIAGSVTGGDSFCYLSPQPSFGNLNTIDFHLSHKGKYPVYDLFIRVWDESCLERIDYGQLYEKYHGYRTKEVTLGEWEKMKNDPDFIRKNTEMEKEVNKRMRNCLIFQGNLGTITPNKSSNLMESPLLSCTVPPGVDLSKYSKKYSVNITARNAQYNQNIIINIRNKRWHIYSKVEKVISDSQRIVVREYESQDSEGFVILLLK